MRLFRSLASRFTLASLLVLPAVLGLSGYMLDQAFQRSLTSAEKNRLSSQMYMLLGSIDISDGQPKLSQELHDPGFSRPGSGLYAWIFTPEGMQWQSPSVLFPTPSDLKPERINAGKEHFQDRIGDLGRVFSLSFDVEWESSDGNLPVRLIIWHDSTVWDAELRSYRQQLGQWLGSLGVFIILAQLLIMRWGLQPLKRLKSDIDKLRESPDEQLPGNYPSEIIPVTQSLNQVLANQTQQSERYKNTLNDLAHSLKTPLAVISGFAQQDPELEKKLADPLRRMDEIVSHQLSRASLGAKVNINRSINLRQLCKRLIAALGKVYDRDEKDFSLLIPADCLIQGEEADFMELMGNLLDNACKYGRRQVFVDAEEMDGQWVIRVEDDGPGVAGNQRQSILTRGQRADTANKGQGIGLAVAIDIVSAYSGSVEVGRSPILGGASFILTLPVQR
ncbi:ATP-binding protein [Pseudoteredinibacter isoporae]|uniref:histidine kinase n=1 Tax=Pseudoteredinibacter isoporae TaxID=570281 RepID=A0A7X0JVC8_9GAMM|nr:ATP-binding protein [Pseudoteredinibacter isoporae]MBB6522957.1 two-component system sensor histidine kinase PhoQ [Pseudoteredinibacter isoporae]NHO88481.1 two-component sensor histidine kinase [Pseudoteredinibacter isoporae]NIB22120.1 two-component sensor histidine kinase [Pseudoteredinibacter isoporae]